jgi:hypothetical protein
MPERIRLAHPPPTDASTPIDPVASGLAAALDGLARLPELIGRLLEALGRPAAPAALSGRSEGAEPAALAEIVERLAKAVERIEPPDRQLATGPEELCQRLGISKTLLRRGVLRGEIPPPVKCGTKLLFSTEVIRAWLAGDTRIKKG